MAGLLNILGIVVGAVGVFFGFYYYFAGALPTAVAVVTATTVGIVGILAFVRHVVFHRSDARRLGWETDRPDWMFEVGFANLAFGLMGIVSVLAPFGLRAQVLVLSGYALYLFQAACLHGYRYFTDEKKSPSRLWRSTLLTLLYVGLMLFFALSSLRAW